MTALRAIAGGADRGAVLSSSIVVGSLGLLTLSVTTNARPAQTTPILAALITLAVGYRRLLAWRSLMVGLVIVILFVPIRRYAIPGHLPFQLEPYRFLVIIVAAASGLGYALTIERIPNLMSDTMTHFGAQYGAKLATRIKPDFLRLGLAVVILLVGARMAIGLAWRPDEIFSIEYL